MAEGLASRQLLPGRRSRAGERSSAFFDNLGSMVFVRFKLLVAAAVCVTCASAQVTLQKTASIPIPGAVTAVAGDFNNDGKPDLATVGLNQTTLEVFPGNGDGTFGAAINSTFPCGVISGLAVGHFHASTNLDIVGGCS